MKIISVVGARPNFMKIAPFIKALKDYTQKSEEPVQHILVHTGQHYDVRLSKTFFTDLSIPEPDINLEIGSGSHGKQLGQTMMAFEKVLLDHRPDWVVVVGDVNATLACTVIAKRLQIKVAHIEAGLRSFDMGMPEEINRLVTDRLSDILFTPDHISSAHLRNEGTPEEKIHLVGNIMIDTLEKNKQQAALLGVNQIIKTNLINSDFQITEPSEDFNYALVTLHRPSNVDQPDIFRDLIAFLLNDVVKSAHLIWPVHPRAKKQLIRMRLWDKLVAHPRLFLLHPLRYHEMLRLNMTAKIMLTDSGGLQEECCVLGTPCLTVRTTTERPITLRSHSGSTVLVGIHTVDIKKEFYRTLSMDHRPSRPPFWDGHAAERIVEVLLNGSTFQTSHTQKTIHENLD